MAVPGAGAVNFQDIPSQYIPLWVGRQDSGQVRDTEEEYRIQNNALSCRYMDPSNTPLMSRIVNPLTPNDHYSGRTAQLTSKRCILYIQEIQVLNILNMVYTVQFFSSKCSLFHNSNVFGSCIIHILYTGVLKLKKK